MNNNGDNKATGKDPLFKMSSERHGSWFSKGAIAKIIVYGICVALIILGAMFNLTALSIIGMSVFVLFTIALVVIAAKNKQVREYENEQYIENELASFETDLIHTMYAYDLDYTAKDINQAVDGYKEVLQQEVASISDLGEEDIAAVADLLKKKRAFNKNRDKKNGKSEEAIERGMLKKD